MIKNNHAEMTSSRLTLFQEEDGWTNAPGLLKSLVQASKLPEQQNEEQ